MRVTTALLVAALALAAAVPRSRAGIDVTAPLPKGSDLALVVIEAPGCDYCALFRRDVLPSYAVSERAKDVPIRFIDINDEAAGSFELEAPLDVVPTFVVLRNNKEIGRIPGYMGPEYFFHTVDYLISRAP